MAGRFAPLDGYEATHEIDVLAAPRLRIRSRCTGRILKPVRGRVLLHKNDGSASWADLSDLRPAGPQGGGQEEEEHEDADEDGGGPAGDPKRRGRAGVGGGRRDAWSTAIVVAAVVEATVWWTLLALAMLAMFTAWTYTNDAPPSRRQPVGVVDKAMGHVRVGLDIASDRIATWLHR
jgi:hypothetical protein